MSNNSHLKGRIAPNIKQTAEKNLTEKRTITPEMEVKTLWKNGIEIDKKKYRSLGLLAYQPRLKFIRAFHPDGRKYIAPKQHEAGLMQCCSVNYNGEEVRKMAYSKGLKC